MIKRIVNCITGVTQKEIEELKSELEKSRAQYKRLLQKNRSKRKYTRKTPSNQNKNTSK